MKTFTLIIGLMVSISASAQTSKSVLELEEVNSLRRSMELKPLLELSSLSLAAKRHAFYLSKSGECKRGHYVDFGNIRFYRGCNLSSKEEQGTFFEQMQDLIHQTSTQDLVSRAKNFGFELAINEKITEVFTSDETLVGAAIRDSNLEILSVLLNPAGEYAGVAEEIDSDGNHYRVLDVVSSQYTAYRFSDDSIRKLTALVQQEHGKKHRAMLLINEDYMHRVLDLPEVNVVPIKEEVVPTDEELMSELRRKYKK